MIFRILAASAIFALTFVPAWGADANLADRAAELQAMSAEDRRAALGEMNPDERKALWLALQNAEREGRPGARKPVEGFYRDAVSEIEPGDRVSMAATAAGARAVGTITYDDGNPTTIFGGGAIIGNRFDTHTGIPVLASGTVSTVVGVLKPGTNAAATDDAFFAVLGPQTAGGGATAIFSSTITGISGATETVTVTGIGANYTGDSFLVLFSDNSDEYIPAFSTGSVDGQGHHGIVGYTGGTHPNITSTFDFGNTLNGLVRASGNILPVELIEYGIE